MTDRSLSCEPEVAFGAQRIRLRYAVPPGTLEKLQNELMQAEYAHNTLKARDGALKVFERYCAAFAACPLPATPETLKSFLTWAVCVRRYRFEYIALVLWAVRVHHANAQHVSPIDESVRTLWSNCRRAIKQPRQAKRALTVEQLRHLLGSLTSDDAMDTRDRAIIGLGFASALRRSELAALWSGDITIGGKGVLVNVRSSKTDQEGRGELLAIPYAQDEQICPVRVLERWIAVRGTWSGPLFTRFTLRREPTRDSIRGPSIATAVKRGLRRIGVDPGEYGAHSLRAGMATAAAEAGASVIAIQMRTRHRSVASVMRYIRPAQAFRADPLAGVL